MIVFIAGMGRSGSTYSFNIARTLLERRGTVYHEPTHDLVSILSRMASFNHLIFKGHFADEASLKLGELGALKVICTIRKPEDSIASMIEIFGIDLEIAIKNTLDWLTVYQRMQAFALTIAYELIDLDPGGAARRIADFLACDASEDEIRRAAAANNKASVKSRADSLKSTDSNVSDVGFSFYENDTYYHRHHVSTLESKRGVDRLTSEQIELVRAALSGYVDKDGELVLNRTGFAGGPNP